MIAEFLQKFPLDFLFSAPFERFKFFYPTFYLIVFLVVKLSAPILTLLVSKKCFSEEFRNNKKGTFLFFLVVFSLFLINQVWIGFFSLLMFLLDLIRVKFKIKFDEQYLKLLSELEAPSSFTLRFSLGFIVSILVIVRFVLVFYTQNYAEGDASCRLVISQIWADYYLRFGSIRDILFPIADWLPLPFYLNGLVIKLTNNIVFVRVLQMIFSVLCIIPLYKISKLLFNSKAALITVFLYIIYPCSIFLGLQTMSETSFLFFLSFSFYFFLRYYKYPVFKNLFFHIVFFVCASLIRFEAWPLAIYFLIITLRSLRKFNYSLLIQLFFYFIVPLFFMYGNVLWGFSPLKWLLYSDQQVSFTFDLYGRDLTIFLKGYAGAFIPFGLLITLYVVYSYRAKGQVVLYSLFLLFYFFPFIYKNITYSIFPQFRYLYLYEFFLIPYLGVFAYNLYKLNRGIGYLCLLSLSLLIYSSSYYMNYNRLLPNQSYQKTLDFCKNINGSFVLDCHPGLVTYDFIANLRMPIVLNYTDEYLKDFLDKSVFDNFYKQNLARKVVFVQNDYDQQFGVVNKDNLYKSMELGGVLVLFPGGKLHDYFSFSNKIETWEGIQFSLILNENNYMVYQITGE